MNPRKLFLALSLLASCTSSTDPSATKSNLGDDSSVTSPTGKLGIPDECTPYGPPDQQCGPGSLCLPSDVYPDENRVLMYRCTAPPTMWADEGVPCMQYQAPTCRVWLVCGLGGTCNPINDTISPPHALGDVCNEDLPNQCPDGAGCYWTPHHLYECVTSLPYGAKCDAYFSYCADIDECMPTTLPGDNEDIWRCL